MCSHYYPPLPFSLSFIPLSLPLPPSTSLPCSSPCPCPSPGPSLPGSYLLRCAEVELKLGQSATRFQEKAYSEFITPLKAFLEIDIKAVMVRVRG